MSKIRKTSQITNIYIYIYIQRVSTLFSDNVHKGPKVVKIWPKHAASN